VRIVAGASPLAQVTVLDWRWTPADGWVNRMATTTSNRMPVQFPPNRGKPAPKKPKKGGKA
jgi:hypothetical protein